MCCVIRNAIKCMGRDIPCIIPTDILPFKLWHIVVLISTVVKSYFTTLIILIFSNFLLGEFAGTPILITGYWMLTTQNTPQPPQTPLPFFVTRLFHSKMFCSRSVGMILCLESHRDVDTVKRSLARIAFNFWFLYLHWEEKKGKTQERMERGSRKRSSSAGSEKVERVGGR